MGGFKSFFHRIIWMSIIVVVPMIFATFINNIYACYLTHLLKHAHVKVNLFHVLLHKKAR